MTNKLKFNCALPLYLARGSWARGLWPEKNVTHTHNAATRPPKVGHCPVQNRAVQLWKIIKQHEKQSKTDLACLTGRDWPGATDLAWLTWHAWPGVNNLAWLTWHDRPGVPDLVWLTWHNLPAGFWLGLTDLTFCHDKPSDTSAFGRMLHWTNLHKLK